MLLPFVAPVGARVAAIRRAAIDDRLDLLLPLLGDNEYCRYVAFCTAVGYNRLGLVSSLIEGDFVDFHERAPIGPLGLSICKTAAMAALVIDGGFVHAKTPEQRATVIGELQHIEHWANRLGHADIGRYIADGLAREAERHRQLLAEPRRSSRKRVRATTSELCAQCDCYHSIEQETCRQ